MSTLYVFALFLFIFLSVFLCFMILIQEGKGGGMGVAFGGDSGEALFGTSTADVLKKMTGWLSAAFLIACLILSAWTASINRTAPVEPPVIQEEL